MPALRWSIGSTRGLLRGRYAPSSLQLNIHPRAQKSLHVAGRVDEIEHASPPFKHLHEKTPGISDARGWVRYLGAL